MAFLTSRPDFSTTMPDVSPSGVGLLNSITATTIWGENSLQYYLGGANALSLDSDFVADMNSIFYHAQPDAAFAFTAVTKRAFTMIDAVSQIDFTRTFDPAIADQVVVSTDDKPGSDTEGFFDFPGDAFHDGSDSTDSWSFGAFNSGLGYMLKGAETGGGAYANWTVLHELGHSLGLKHTHKEYGRLPPLDTVGKFMDNEKYSVMSYNDASNGTTYGHAVSMMGLDVAALQALYGAEDYATGKSTYTLLDARGGKLGLSEGDVAIGRAYYCIWDSGGSDTIDYGNSRQSVLINLNDATLDTDSVSNQLTVLFSELKVTSFYKNLSAVLQQEIVDKWHHAGGFFSHVLTRGTGDYKAIDGGFSIAHGAQIENATGGDASDLLIGNEGGNTLRGFGGNDTMLGGAGADTLFGGMDNDWLDGGRGDDILMGGAGSDRFVFSDHYGFDIIADFTHNDIIDLSRLTAFKSYTDLFDNKMTQHKGSTYIMVGDDTLALYDVKKSELTHSDFII